MKSHALAITAVLAIAAAGPLTAAAETEKGSSMENKVRGKFDVKMSPAANEEHAGGVNLGRFGLDKRYHGALDATATGEMLSATTAVQGSAGYVAIERVEGSLDGRQGSFVLQHTGTMGGGEQKLTITVVPDSGTGELAGIDGRLEIVITDGEHFYEFEYSLPAAP